MSIGKYLIPEIIEVIQSPPYLVWEVIFSFSYIFQQFFMHTVHDAVCIFIIASILDAAWCIIIRLACIQLLTLIELLYLRKEKIYYHITKLLGLGKI